MEKSCRRVYLCKEELMAEKQREMEEDQSEKKLIWIG